MGQIWFIWCSTHHLVVMPRPLQHVTGRKCIRQKQDLGANIAVNKQAMVGLSITATTNISSQYCASSACGIQATRVTCGRNLGAASASTMRVISSVSVRSLSTEKPPGFGIGTIEKASIAKVCAQDNMIAGTDSLQPTKIFRPSFSDVA